MNPDRARLIDAFHLQRRSLKHIATEHGRSVKSIERRLARARADLKRILTPHLTEHHGAAPTTEATP